MKLLDDLSPRGDKVLLRDAKLFYMQFALGNYCAGVPKRRVYYMGNTEISQTCFVRDIICRYDMGLYKVFKNHTLRETLDLLETYSQEMIKW